MSSNEDKARWRKNNKAKQSAYVRLQQAGIPRAKLTRNQFNQLVALYQQAIDLTKETKQKYCVAVIDQRIAKKDPLRNCQPSNLEVAKFSEVIARSHI